MAIDIFVNRHGKTVQCFIVRKELGWQCWGWGRGVGGRQGKFDFFPFENLSELS